MTKHEQLTELLESLTGDNTPHGIWMIEFRGRNGWWCVSEHPLHFGDNGEYLGQTYREAVKGVKFLFAVPSTSKTL